MRRGQRRYTTAEKHAAIAKVNGGKYAGVSRELGIPISTLQRWAIDFGLEPRKKRWTRPKLDRNSTEDMGAPICGVCRGRLEFDTDGNGFVVYRCTRGCNV
jgi:hypothetical protein